MKLLCVAAVLCCLVSTGACGALGLGSTTLALGDPTPDGFRFDEADTIDHSYFRFEVNVCTDGDDEVKVTGVRIKGQGAPKVVAFRVSHEQYNDSSGGGSSLGKRPASVTSGPSEPFSQKCGGAVRDGRTYVTVDSKVAGLPVETDEIVVSYRTGGDDKSVDLTVPVVLCGESTGCPPDPDDQFNDDDY